MIFIRVQTFQRAASPNATLNTNATIHVITLSFRSLSQCRSLCWKIDVLYSASVCVHCTSLLAGLCVSRTLQRTIAAGTALLTCVSVAFQTASSTRTALITSVSLTDNWGAVTPGTDEFTFSGNLTCQVTVSTSWSANATNLFSKAEIFVPYIIYTKPQIYPYKNSPGSYPNIRTFRKSLAICFVQFSIRVRSNTFLRRLIY